MLKYAGEDGEAGDGLQSFVTVIRSSNAGLNYWRERLTVSYVIVDGAESDGGGGGEIKDAAPALILRIGEYA